MPNLVVEKSMVLKNRDDSPTGYLPNAVQAEIWFWLFRDGMEKQWE